MQQLNAQPGTLAKPLYQEIRLVGYGTFERDFLAQLAVFSGFQVHADDRLDI